jgi:RHS repeat-associated protein
MVSKISNLKFFIDDCGPESNLNVVSTSHHNYDSNGNRINGTCNGKPYTATYGAQDRLTSFKNRTFLYNDNGELVLAADALSQTSTIYNYDVLGRLSSVKLLSGKAVSYQIDARGRRVIKNIDGVKVHSYVYLDDLRIAAESNDDCDPNFDRNCATLKTNFTYSGNKPTPDYFFSLIDGNNYKIITDQIGSVRLVINTLNGSEAQRIDYDEWGNVISDTNPGFQPFGYAGGIYDQDTKLVHFGARDYDPSTGRWLSKDPIGFGGGDTNLFGYVASDPINDIDPSGLSDINLFPPTERISTSDLKIPDPPNTFTVGGHGSKYSMFNKKGKPITAAQLANLIRSDSRYLNGEAVRLNSCLTGGSTSTGSNFAQQLANILGAPVDAPTEILWIGTDGSTSVQKPGGFKRFTPLK